MMRHHLYTPLRSVLLMLHSGSSLTHKYIPTTSQTQLVHMHTANKVPVASTSPACGMLLLTLH
jgi:hypothetical protein